jgi:uncharacterized cupredoxin-like copper-binding protein
VGILRHGGPLLVELLGGCPTPTTWQASGGDRHLKFYQVRDNLQAVIKTNKAPGALPVAKTTATADETGDLGEAEDIAAGASKSVTLLLKPGHYVLICNLAGHYQVGMHTAFTVR